MSTESYLQKLNLLTSTIEFSGRILLGQKLDEWNDLRTGKSSLKNNSIGSLKRSKSVDRLRHNFNNDHWLFLSTKCNDLVSIIIKTLMHRTPFFERISSYNIYEIYDGVSSECKFHNNRFKVIQKIKLL